MTSDPIEWARRTRALALALCVALAAAAAVAIAASGSTPSAFAQANDPEDAGRTDPEKRGTDPDAEKDKPPPNIDGQLVVLQGLDKETARIMTFGGKVGATVTFRSLKIVIRRCQKTPPQVKPEKAAFLQIFDVDPESKKEKMVFSGWMFASSPALSAMDHPTYDIWVKDCR